MLTMYVVLCVAAILTTALGLEVVPLLALGAVGVVLWRA